MNILILFLILEEMFFQRFTFEYDVSCKFAIYGSYCVEVYSLYAYLLESFDHK